MPLPTEIRLSRHVCDRASERSGASPKRVRRDVADAIAAGRKAVNVPAWARHPEIAQRGRADRTRAGAARGELRWVWDEPEETAYLVRFFHDFVLVITTVYRPRDAA